MMKEINQKCQNEKHLIFFITKFYKNSATLDIVCPSYMEVLLGNVGAGNSIRLSSLMGGTAFINAFYEIFKFLNY
jgi:hypothetical protein